MTMNHSAGIKIGTHEGVEQLFMLDKTGILTGLEGRCFSPGEHDLVENLRSIFVLDLPKPRYVLGALESFLPDDVSDFSPENAKLLKALYDSINSQIPIPHIKELSVGAEITARHMELAGAVERLKEKPCAMIHSQIHMGHPWYDIDCRLRFSWKELEDPQRAQVVE